MRIADDFPAHSGDDVLVTRACSCGGTIYKRVRVLKSGRESVLWYGVISLSGPDGAKRTQDWGRGHHTRREAQVNLRQRIIRLETSSLSRPLRLELGPYLFEHWLPSVADRISPTTMAGYERAIGRIVTRLGRVRLRDLSPMHLNRLYQELRVVGGVYQDPARVGESRPLSPSSVRAVHVVLSKALNDAIDMDLLATNPARRAKPPRLEPLSSKVVAWSAEDLARFLDFVKHDRLFVAWHLAAHSGMRR